MEIVFRVFLFLIGACLGSFLCCQARRLRYNLTHKAKLKKSRSICLHCKKTLKWSDNLPIISWLILKGKCRHCHKKIGLAELLAELGTAVSFLLLSFTIDITTIPPLEWLVFVSVLVLTCLLIFLAIYDGLYGELPSVFLFLSITCGFIISSLKIWLTLSTQPFSPTLIINPLLSLLVLGGLYLLLYAVSKGRWVGDGDWLLATAIGITLSHPFLALIALFLANFSACLIMLPAMKGNPKAKIHFGPFLVVAFVLTYSFSSFFMSLML